MRHLIFSSSLLTLSALVLGSVTPTHARAIISASEGEKEIFNSDWTIAQQSAPDPNRERFTQPNSEPLPPKPQEPEQILPTPEEKPQTPPPEENESGVTIPVSKIEVLGSTVFGAQELDPIIKPLEGRSVTFKELEGVAQAITKMYVERGYITSRAVLSPQEITNGVVKIRVIEGSLAEIQVEGTDRLSRGFIRDRIELGTDTPLRADRIEEQLQLLQANPIIEKIEANLQPGKEEGQSQLVVDVEEANAFQLGFNVDNYTNVSTGGERAGVSLGYLNLAGIGDSIFLSYNRSFTGGSNVVDFSYNIPLTANDGTLQLRTIIERQEITQEPFDAFEIESESERYEISYRQPIIRSLQDEFALSFGFSYQDSRNSASEALLAQAPVFGRDDRINVIKFGQDYTHRDPQGVLSLRSQFNLGVDWFGATDRPSPEADSNFFSWLFQAQRLQRLSDNNLLIAQFDLQLTPDNLLSDEQFVIGGAQSVRGYRQNVRSADNGLRFSLEDRITLAKTSAGEPILVLAPFFDMGYVWNDEDNTNSLDQQFIAGLGLGVLVQPVKGLNIRLDYAPPLIDLEDRGDNVQDDGFYFSVTYQTAF